MSTHLVTGKAGYEHVKASDHGALHAAIMGGGEFVLEGGEQFACQVISNNKVRIFDGEAMMQGRHIRIDRNTYEETTHDNGVQGYKRIDLVVLTYTKDEGTGVENVALEVIKGTPAESNPTVPEYVNGDILNNGELKNQMPLYKIPFDGLSIGEPVKMFATVPTLQTMKEEVDAKVDAKIAEMGDEFAELEAGIDDKIAEAGKPLSSNANDWALIENYGEYSADAKTVGEQLTSMKTGLNGKAPTNHASTGTGYGIGNASNFGHVKLSDTYASKVSSGAAANGMGASQNALYNTYNTLNTKVSKVKTYVGSDGKLHFVDASGADTALNFSKGTLITSAPITLSNANSSGWYRTAVIDLSGYSVATISNIAFMRINATDVACCLYVVPAYTFSYSNKKLTVNFNTSVDLNGVAHGTTASLIIV